jgi:hypothetical protein
MKILVLVCALLVPTLAHSQHSTTWRFDSTTQIAGHPTTVLGSPKVIQTDIGPAVHFQGNNTAGDALFVDNLPLAGTLDYSLDLIFRPSAKGSPEQRIFHLQEAGSNSRRMFEIRIHGDKWCLDTVAINSPADVATPDPAHTGIMLNCDAAHLFPVDRWYAVTTTYDGKILRSYVNGILQGETPAALMPLGPGGTSIGTRYTRRDFFTGDMFAARFTPAALAPSQFLKVPPH